MLSSELELKLYSLLMELSSAKHWIRTIQVLIYPQRKVKTKQGAMGTATSETTAHRKVEQMSNAHKEDDEKWVQAALSC